MARINVEQELFMDPRFKSLVRTLNHREDEALGLVVRWWLTAQEWWGKEGRQLVPDQFFQLGHWDQLATVGLAEKRDAGWYAKGSEERFKWYADICDKSRHGVEIRAQKKANPGVVPAGQPRGQPTGSKKPRKRQPYSQPSSSIYAPTSETAVDNHCISDTPAAVSPVLILGQIAGLNPGDKPDFAVRDKADNARVWDAYSAAYTQRYGAPPKSSSMGYGLCKRLVQRLGVQPAIEVARFFLTVNKRWYIENLHPLSSAVKDAEALHTQMVTGRTMTSTQADQKDRTQSNLEAARGAVELLARGKGNPFDVSNQ